MEKIDEEHEQQQLDLKWVAQFDILVTDAIFLYAYHLLEGKVNPESLDATWNYSFRDIMPDAPYLLERAIQTATVSETLHNLRPQNKTYSATQDLMLFYYEIKDRGGWENIPEGQTLRSGDSDERIPLIRKRLAITNELIYSENTDSLTYDSLFMEDVKNFQAHKGLNPDGIIGKGTLEMMNIPVDDRIQTLRVNLERNRWIESDLSDDYIIVNIAAFKAWYIENHKVRFSTRVVVGKNHTKTPVFKDKLRYIEFNPTWTVPYSIVKSSIIPHMKADANYIANKNFELIDRSGNLVAQSSLDASNLSASNFPYTVRQKPGKNNALGEVKFIFPNKYAIYMHDTPSKSLFEVETRAFSYGCIRTEHPLDLAAILLEGTDWGQEKINMIIESKVTTRAFPEKDIDVLIMYWTAGYNEGEGISFFRDIYNRDAKILEELDETEFTTITEKKALENMD